MPSLDIQAYHASLAPEDQAICNLLFDHIQRVLPDCESKVWHGHPVWFMDGNPLVGYSKLKGCVRLLFWSGQSFEPSTLKPEGKFKAAEERYTSLSEVDSTMLLGWLEQSRTIQWDYKNLIKRKGKLERLQ
jgi:hypothetical protein